MLKPFYSDKFDSRIVLKNSNKEVSYKELKGHVVANIPVLKTKKKNVLLIPDDIIVFTINFFASIFTGKNIYLVDDINKIRNLDFDFDIINKCEFDFNISVNNFPVIKEEDCYVNLLTSGSSGKNKCIKKNLTNLINEALDINKTFDFSKEEELVITSSTTCAHLFGLTMGFAFPLCTHRTIYANVIEYPDRYNIENSLFVSTPSFLDSTRKNRAVLNGAKYIASAGSKLKDETYKYLESFCKVIEIYGSTETGVIAYRTDSNHKDMTLFENVNIFPFENSVMVKTPYALENEVEICDRIEIVNNKIVLKNRTDRLLKIQEKRVSAEDMENFLNDNDFVSESFCFKYNDKIACLCALTNTGRDFLLKNGIIELIKNLKAFCKLKYDVIPQRWKFTDIIPRTRAGKIDKLYIQHLFEINLTFPVVLDRESSDNTVIYKLFFHKNCNFYSGHFPDYPITPGVVQLYLASFLGERCFSKTLSDGQIRRIKFSNIIHSGEIVYLKLTHKEKSINFEYYNDENNLSSGVFSCENVFEGVLQ